MVRIGVLSDTHGFLDPTLQEHFAECDQIWHAGDIGSIEVLDEINSWGIPLYAVYGNIDAADVCGITYDVLYWQCEGMHILMLHIAGYPGRYNGHAQTLINRYKPDIVVCGHSHILRVMYDQSLQHLHINPGACGMQGLHHMRTAVRFTIDGSEAHDMQVIELGKRGTQRK